VACGLFGHEKFWRHRPDLLSHETCQQRVTIAIEVTPAVALLPDIIANSEALRLPRKKLHRPPHLEILLDGLQELL
jgi:hypothetical protein